MPGPIKLKVTLKTVNGVCLDVDDANNANHVPQASRHIDCGELEGEASGSFQPLDATRRDSSFDTNDGPRPLLALSLGPKATR